ncbi:MAG: hypothetical protein QXJ14_04620 [Candidatus Aenigmatarchaeota archaeon]
MNNINYDSLLCEALNLAADEFRKRSDIVGFITSRMSCEQWVQVEFGYVLQKELYKQGYNKHVIFEYNDYDILFGDIVKTIDDKKEYKYKVNVDITIELKLLYGDKDKQIDDIKKDIDKKTKKQQINYLLFGIFMKNFHVHKNYWAWMNYNNCYENGLNNLINKLKQSGQFPNFKYLHESVPFDFSFSVKNDGIVKGVGKFVILKNLEKNNNR